MRILRPVVQAFMRAVFQVRHELKDFDALSDRCGIPGGHEVEEAADRGKPALAGPLLVD
ncbi:hypothetical protein HB777_37585 (plasmid) [Mesorhizobium loti]|nr:hypothetical protein HB777_37585 [Mesorhizobium loti]